MPFFLVGLTMASLLGCNFYRVSQVNYDNLETIVELGKLHKYFVLHAGDSQYAIQGISVEPGHLTGKIVEVDRTIHYEPGENPGKPKNRIYKGKKERDVLHEVHIYLSEEAGPVALGSARIPSEHLKRIEVIDKNTGLTVATYVGIPLVTIIGIPVAIIAAVGTCPYVYASNSEAFVFEGEIYGGAVLHNLEREDYLPLASILPDDGKFKLRISNELKEHQYTNFANLIIVNHPKGQEVLLDRNGVPRLLSTPTLPAEAFSMEGKNLSVQIAEKDGSSFLFNDESLNKNAAVLAFPKPAEAKTGKLVLRAKNTLWGNYVLGKFLKMFGSYYDTWIEQVKAASPEERRQAVIDNFFPLTVYVKRNEEWQAIDHLWPVGLMHSRDLVVPINLEGIDTDTIEVKLETGFLFWELDYVAMDFTPDTGLALFRQLPEEAYASDGRDCKALLTADDKQYLVQKQIGELAELHFKTTPCPEGQAQSVFLHTKGYYEIIRNFDGRPEWEELKKFQEPGYNTEFSRLEFLKMKALSEEEVLSPFEPPQKIN